MATITTRETTIATIAAPSFDELFFFPACKTFKAVKELFSLVSKKHPSTNYIDYFF
ncbi:hypothetical protein Hanom_Chr01g00045011 [Helianthus anomalus]